MDYYIMEQGAILYSFCLKLNKKFYIVLKFHKKASNKNFDNKSRVGSKIGLEAVLIPILATIISLRVKHPTRVFIYVF